MPLVVIISGLPCTGKTTLGRWLAQELSLPFVHKDGIKELLFDHLGWQDRAWSKALGRASSELLYYFAEAQLAVGRSLLLESNFNPAFATPKFQALQVQYPFTPVQIFCKADGAALFQRFQQRSESGERHPGHVDHLNYAEFEAILQQGRLAPLAIGGELIEVETTAFEQIPYAALRARLQSIQAEIGLI